MSVSRSGRSELRRASAWGLVSVGIVLTAFVLDARIAAWAPAWKHPVVDFLVRLVNPIGSGVTPLVACAIVVACGRVFRRPRLEGAAWLGMLAFALAGALEFTLKHLVSRSRPDAGLSSLAFLGPAFLPDVDSFPSGHATSVFTVATAFASCYPAVRPLLYVLAAAVAVGRVYLARHYFSDIVAGATIGILIAALLRRHPAVRARWLTLDPTTLQ
jgi:membrane-associated phospholipid phosphatase